MKKSEIKQPLPVPQKLFKTCFWKSPAGKLIEVLVPVPLPSSKKEEPLELIIERMQNLRKVEPAPFPRAIAPVSEIASAPIIVPPSVAKTNLVSTPTSNPMYAKCVTTNQIPVVNQNIASKPLAPKIIYKTVPVSIFSPVASTSSNIGNSSHMIYNKSIISNHLSHTVDSNQVKGQIVSRTLNFSNQQVACSSSGKSSIASLSPNFNNQQVACSSSGKSSIASLSPNFNNQQVACSSSGKSSIASPSPNFSNQQVACSSSGKSSIASLSPNFNNQQVACSSSGKSSIASLSPVVTSAATPTVNQVSSSILKINNPYTLLVTQPSSAKILNPTGKLQIIQPQGKVPLIQHQLSLNNAPNNIPKKLPPKVNVIPNNLTYSNNQELIKSFHTPLKITENQNTQTKIAYVSNSTSNPVIVANNKNPPTKLVHLPKLPPGFVYAIQNSPVTVVNMPIIVSQKSEKETNKNGENKSNIVNTTLNIKTEPMEIDPSNNNTNQDSPVHNSCKINTNKQNSMEVKNENDKIIKNNSDMNIGNINNTTVLQDSSKIMYCINNNSLLKKPTNEIVNVSSQKVVDLKVPLCKTEKSVNAIENSSESLLPKITSVSSIKFKQPDREIKKELNCHFQSSCDLKVKQVVPVVMETSGLAGVCAARGGPSVYPPPHPHVLPQMCRPQDVPLRADRPPRPALATPLMETNQKHSNLLSQADIYRKVKTDERVKTHYIPLNSVSTSLKSSSNYSEEKVKHNLHSNAFNQQFLKFILHSPQVNKITGKITAKDYSDSSSLKNKLTDEKKQNMYSSKIVSSKDENDITLLSKAKDPLDLFIPEIELIEEENTVTIPNWSPRDRSRNRRFVDQRGQKRKLNVKIKPPERISQKCKLQMWKSKASNLLGDCYVVLRPLKLNRIVNNSVDLNEISETELFSEDETCDLYSNSYQPYRKKRLKLSIYPDDAVETVFKPEPSNNSKMSVSSDYIVETTNDCVSSKKHLIEKTIGSEIIDFCQNLMHNIKQTSDKEHNLNTLNTPKEFICKGHSISEKNIAIHYKDNDQMKTPTDFRKHIQNKIKTESSNSRIHILRQKLLNALNETDKIRRKN